MKNPTFSRRAFASSDHTAPRCFLRLGKKARHRRALAGSVAALLAGLTLWLPSDAPATVPVGPLPATYWLGENSNAWNGNNWASDASGTPTSVTPTGSDDITFSAAGAANQSTVLNSGFSIHSLTINDPIPVTINPGAGGPYTLTISGNAGTGITVNSGAGLFTIGFGANVTFTGSSNTITVNNAAGAVIDSAIGGANGLIKAGTGMLTIGLSTTYTGPTVVNGGTLLITGGTNAVNIGSTSAVTINNGGTISIVGNNNYLGQGFAPSQITTINQGGALTMDVQYTAHVGPLVLAGGTLASSGTSTVNTTEFAGFNLDGGVTAGGVAATSTISAQYVALTQVGGTVFNVSSGSSSGVDLNVTGSFVDGAFLTNTGLVKQGAGLMLLSGANTFTEATTISAGTLQYANEVSFYNNTPASASKVTVASGATIAFNVGGPGQFTLADLTTIQANSAGFASGARLGLDTTNAAGGNFTYASPITNANGGASVLSLVKLGTGTLTLTGANTYTGSTIVNQGTLMIDGSVASPNISVLPGAFLGGTGILGGNLMNSGVVNPGDPPGTLTVKGNYTQSSTGTLLIRVGGLAVGQHDLLSVGGSASLAGTLQLQQLNGFQFRSGEEVTLLTASGGVSGKFSTVVNPFATGPLVGTTVVYLPDSVLLEATQLPIFGKTPNQQAVAHALDASLLDPRNAAVIAHLDNESIASVLNDLDRIAPAELTSIYQIAVSQAKIQTANLQRRLEDVRAGSSGFSAAGLAMNGGAPAQTGSFEAAGPSGLDGKDGKAVFTPAPDNRWGVFVTGTGEWANVGDTSNARGYDLTNAGFTLGVDYKVTDHFVIGLATGYDHSTADLTSNGRVTVDNGKLTLYSSFFTGTGFYADLAVGGGLNGYQTHRAALLASANGSDNGGEFNLLFGTGYDWKIGGLTFGPTANFEYTYVGIDSFEERGSLAPLDYSNQYQESIRSTFGAKVSYDWKIGSVLVRPELRAGWQHEYSDATLGIDSSFANGAGPDFLVHGPATGRDSLLLSAGVAVQWSPRVSTYVYYDGELARANYQANSVSGGFRVEF